MGKLNCQDQHDNFKQVAERRVRLILKAIESLALLWDKPYYFYTQKDAIRIITAIETEVHKLGVFLKGADLLQVEKRIQNLHKPINFYKSEGIGGFKVEDKILLQKYNVLWGDVREEYVRGTALIKTAPDKHLKEWSEKIKFRLKETEVCNG